MRIKDDRISYDDPARDRETPSFSSTRNPQSAFRNESVECRVGCGACCVAPSISTPIPGMPEGKPAGVRCVQLTEDNRCLLFGRPERPAVCASLRPSEEMCGHTTRQAYTRLTRLERLTGRSAECRVMNKR